MYDTLVDGVVVQITQAQMDEMTASPPAAEQRRGRRERDRLIASTDWWATSDRTMTAEQTAYRQALRDITDQDDFPTNITWPTKPS